LINGAYGMRLHAEAYTERATDLQAQCKRLGRIRRAPESGLKVNNFHRLNEPKLAVEERARLFADGRVRISTDFAMYSLT
jgi:hypothetical protein